MNNEILNNVITKSEFREGIEKLATKEDLKKYATKTNEEIRKLSDKVDWLTKKVMINTEKYNRLATKIISHVEKIELMETKEDADKKFNQIMNRFDDIIGILNDMRTEKIVTDACNDQVREKD